MPGRWRLQTLRLQSILVETCWRPMEGDVAGDFHDVFDLRDGRAAMVIGDVAGFGPKAAERADELEAEVRRAFRWTDHPPEVLRQLDKWTAAQGDLFATVACAVIDPAVRAVHVASAGHPPMVIGHGGTARFVNGLADPPLGLGSDRRLITYPLVEPAALFLYTDGLVERRGSNIGECLETLLEAAAEISTESVGADELVRAATKRFGQPADDATVVSVRFTGQASSTPAPRRNATDGSSSVTLRVYVDPRDLRSTHTEQVARELTRQVPDRLQLHVEVVDVTAPGAAMEADGLMALPTVIRVAPEPRIRVVGGLRSYQELARALHLPLKEEGL